jgi:peroxiredoxin
MIKEISPMAVSAGDTAPDFEVKNQDNEMVTLSSLLEDSAVALVFYPFTFSGRCEGELCSLRDDKSQFDAAGVQVVAMSCDSPFAQKKWSEEQGFNFPVLADNWPHGAVAQAYGVFNDAVGCANRATFLIGKDGKVVDAFATDSLGTARDQARYEEAVAKL